jgi:F-type H+-transporting ATPase subunit delta
MAELNSVARPYANAAFSVAIEKNDLSKWRICLLQAAQLVTVEQFKQILIRPKITKEERLNCFFDLLEGNLTEEIKRFFSLLDSYHHLFLMEKILVEFEILRAEYEKRMKISISSAVALNAQEEAILLHALEKRLQRKIDADYTVDPGLLAGVLIHVGDQVIDGSMRGQLERMKQQVMSD